MNILKSVALILLLASCGKTWDWTPASTDTRQYFRYDEEPGFCFGQCPSYFIYVFDDGEVVYHGEGTVQRKGLKKKFVDPSLFQNVLAILDNQNFSNLAERYWFETDQCGDEYITDQGQIHYTLFTPNITKTVIYDYGCLSAKDGETILGIRDSLQKILPTASWVGKQHFNWDQQ